MASDIRDSVEKRVTIADIVGEMRAKNIEHDYDIIMRLYAMRIEEAHGREVAELQRRIDKQKEINKALVDENDAIRAKIKVVEDALEKCKTAMCNYCRSTPEAKGLPCVNGCETLAIAMDALAAIREEGGAK